MNLKLLNKESLTQKTRIFFQSKKWKNLLVFCAFVVLAFFFWLLRYYQQKFEVEVFIPVRYEKVPQNIVLSSSAPEKISVKIQDKGTVLLNYFLSLQKKVIVINLEGISHKNKSYTVQHSTLSSKIYEHLQPTTQLASFYPEIITIDYSPLATKELPVALGSNIQAAQGYVFVEDIQINPSRVTAWGSSQALDNLTKIETVPLKNAVIDKNLNTTLSLVAPAGIRLSADKVNITADIEAFTEKDFELPILSSHLPENLYVRFFPSTVSVVCQVVLSKYSKLKETDLEIRVNYNELRQSKGPSIPLKLSKKPKEIINCRIIPDRVEYLIEQKRNL
jgi:YbbR domain-containing protein